MATALAKAVLMEISSPFLEASKQHPFVKSILNSMGFACLVIAFFV